MRTGSAFSIITIILMFLVHLFAVYTIRRPRYTIKRLTALLHLMTGKEVWGVYVYVCRSWLAFLFSDPMCVVPIISISTSTLSNGMCLILLLNTCNICKRLEFLLNSDLFLLRYGFIHFYDFFIKHFIIYLFNFIFIIIIITSRLSKGM